MIDHLPDHKVPVIQITNMVERGELNKGRYIQLHPFFNWKERDSDYKVKKFVGANTIRPGVY